MTVVKPKAKPKPKPKPKKKIAGVADWFAKMSPQQKKDYIAKHPNSIYAKNPTGASKNQLAHRERNRKNYELLKTLAREYDDASNAYGVCLDNESDIRKFKGNGSPEHKAAIAASTKAHDKCEAVQKKITVIRKRLKLE